MSHLTIADGVTMAWMWGGAVKGAGLGVTCVLSLSLPHWPPRAPVSGGAGKGHARSASGGGLRFPGHPEECLWPTRALLASLSPEHLPYDVSKESHVFNPEIITCFGAFFPRIFAVTNFHFI